MTSALKRVTFGWQILIALVLGIGLGLVAQQLPVPEGAESNWLGATLATIGELFVQLLRVIVIPLVVTAIIASITNLKNVTNAARLAGKTLLWFCITALIAVAIGMTIGLVTQPGANTTISQDAAQNPESTGSWSDFLTGLFPVNILGLSADTSLEAPAAGGAPVASTELSFNVLQLVVLALVIGIAALKVGKPAEPFLAFNRSLLAIVSKVLWWVIRLAPIGTVGLLGNAVANYGWEALSPLAVFAVDVYIGCAIVMFVVYPLLAKAHGLSARKWFSGAWPAIQLGFVSRSSVGTLPMTQRVTERNLGVPQGYASFAVPFGATTKMDGCAAIYPALAAIFVAQFFGIQLQISDYLLIAFVSVIGSAATAGLTGAIVMLTLTLSTLGLPLAGVGLLLAVDPILDMMRTATNVAGQTLIPTLVAKQEKILDVDRYNAVRSDNGFVPEAGETIAAEQDGARDLEPSR
ncbi:dicarboxylate/amino acid:cation symporter [Saxibacter everestensis]|uniref:Dicarboxylate/amino acid:cation symporter n=1 Tax=Saxibacter everestensis TaxID=2909229 RepID=A0ABY8QYX0_9MICO|nr:dicarboxylate/amino acid:cation symporter [Brevibacteriaceae bacterium ZFBP1038]